MCVRVCRCVHTRTLDCICTCSLSRQCMRIHSALMEGYYCHLLSCAELTLTPLRHRCANRDAAASLSRNKQWLWRLWWFYLLPGKQVAATRRIRALTASSSSYDFYFFLVFNLFIFVFYTQWLPSQRCTFGVTWSQWGFSPLLTKKWEWDGFSFGMNFNSCWTKRAQRAAARWLRRSLHHWLVF